MVRISLNFFSLLYRSNLKINFYRPHLFYVIARTWLIQASSLNIAEKAGEIIRDVMQRGELGVVDKVFHNCSRLRNSPRTYIKHILQTLQGENKQFDPQTEADRWVEMDETSIMSNSPFMLIF